MFINSGGGGGGGGGGVKRHRTRGTFRRNTSNNSSRSGGGGILRRKLNFEHHHAQYDKDQIAGRSGHRKTASHDDNDDGDDNDTIESSRDAYRRQRKEEDERIDTTFGFERYTHGPKRLGWLINMRSTTVSSEDEEVAESDDNRGGGMTGPERSAVDMYFIQQDGSTFKATLKYEPYFYIGVRDNAEMAVEDVLKRHYEHLIANISLVEKNDLDMPNHLSGKMAKYLRVSFHNVQNLLELRRVLLPLVEKNKKNMAKREAYDFFKGELGQDSGDDDDDDNHHDLMVNSDDEDDNGDYTIRRERSARSGAAKIVDYTECIVDIREYDVKYHVRLAIDLDIRVGYWYEVCNVDGEVQFHRRDELVERAVPRVCAFDIETTKLPLMFPNAEIDQVMMISYMIDGQGFLIVNREIVSEDIDDFDYTPRPEYPGPFTVYNVADEQALLKKWFSHIREVRPSVMVTYNGDWFDFGFIDQRAKVHGLSMRKEIGFYRDRVDEIYRSTYAIHMDCLYWVKRDSYLPQGSHGLKMVTKAKMGYNPVEVDPEDMMPFAVERPQTLATYSVSDAVATYYLYMKYVHPFTFSLCTIIPMPPDDVLRKGSGTLCETLLMVMAYRANVIAPNRHRLDPEKMYKGHPLESETYIGGHVEALRSGIFRADLPVKFELDSKTYQTLIDDIDHALKFSIEVEQNTALDDVTNFEEVRDAIVSKLEALRDQPKRIERPLIYHLDVGAMYPNIITTNRLQPTAIVDESTCAACVHNRPGSDCQRQMEWHYRAEYFKSTASEYRSVKAQLMSERFPMPHGGDTRSGDSQKMRKFDELSQDEQRAMIKKRLSEYTRKVYKKIYEKESEIRQATICQRENPFYVNTVRDFRDRRNEFKAKLKEWKDSMHAAQEAQQPERVEQAKNMIIVYDSLQVAHKVVLNSFYGYVMRRGARWYSIEMAGVVTYTGAQIIKMARELIDGIGITLELDTDGIWCMLPASFPENYEFITKSGRKLRISYPCVMINADVNAQFTNHQYQDLVDEERILYEKRSECSIFFEVDGPYRAMILPASKEEGKGIKKRYIVYDHDGRIAELKGFEIKRRGELKLIKLFQSRMFESFLNGQTLADAYKAVGDVANQWLDILFTRGQDVEDEELFELLTESSNMSKTISEYGRQKSARITTALRLAEIFGEEMIREKGLVCSYVVSRKPEGAPVSDRVIPVQIFQKEKEICTKFLRIWTKDHSISEIDIRNIIDWDYYIERLGSAIQKIITIPAALQGVHNPVPRIRHPEWLNRQLREKNDSRKQRTLTSMLSTQKGTDLENVMDIESLGDGKASNLLSARHHKRKLDDISPSDEDVESLAQKEQEREQLQQRESLKRRQEARAIKRVQRLLADQHRSIDDAMNDKGFSLWLKAQKLQWKKMLDAKRKHRAGEYMTESELINLSARRPATIGAYMRQQTIALQQHDWHIVQLRETEIPGVMRLFALVNNVMQAMLLRIPRVVYVNLRRPPPNKERTVQRVLPRSRPCLNLYQKELPEELYQARSKELQAQFVHPNVEGIYESHVPLIFRANLELGNLCTLARTAWDKVSKNEPLSMNDLVRKIDGKDRSILSSPYLSSADELKRLFLYHNMVDNRGIMGLFIFPSKRARVYIVQPFRQAEKPAIHWDRLLHDAFHKHTKNGHMGAISQPSDSEIDEMYEQSEERRFNFEVEFVASRTEALQHIQRDLENYHNERRGPSVIMLRSATGSVEICRALPALNDFPLMTMPYSEEDHKYPALQWIQFCTRRMVECIWHVKDFYDRALEYARYAKVPLGNFEPDMHVHAIDMLFGRKLTRQNHLLWASPSTKPDLGGSENDDNLLATSGWTDMDSNFEISRSGIHRSVCVELDINYLVINSIIQSKYINDLLGSVAETSSDQLQAGAMFSMRQEDGESQVSKRKTANEINSMMIGALGLYDESILCGRSFDVLKLLVSEWFNDVGASQNEVADSLISHLYRWLRNSNSKLYDPALFRLVYKLMKKVFLHLLSQLRKLGSKIVYANFNRIIIATSKDTLEDAQSYVSFIIQTLNKQNMFAYIGLEPVKYWDHLLWIDSANFSGILVHSVDDHDDEMTSGDSSSELSQLTQTQDSTIDDSQSQQQRRRKRKKIQMQWNMAQMFPHRDITRDFQQVIKIYLSKLYSEKHARMKSLVTEAGKEMISGDELNKHMEQFAKDLISSHCTPYLLERLPNIKQQATEVKQNMQQQQPQAQADSSVSVASVMRKLSSTHSVDTSTERDYALEFTNSICHVLSHDKTIFEEVLNMKRGMLKLLHVREFSREAKFVNPSRTFKLPDVICANCNECRDLDLCRDPDLLASSTGEPSSRASDNASKVHTTRPTWKCSCGTPYDMNVIESRLVEHVERSIVAFQLQDLRCVKCDQIKVGNLGAHCECSGTYTCQKQERRIKRDLTILHNVAKFYWFDWLEHVVSHALRSSVGNDSPKNW